MIRQSFLPILGIVLALTLTPVLAQDPTHGVIIHGPNSPNDPPGDNPYPPPGAPTPPSNDPWNVPNAPPPSSVPPPPSAPNVNAYTYDNLYADATELARASHHMARSFRPSPGYYNRAQIDSIYSRLYAFDRKTNEFRSTVERKRNNPPDIENDLRKLVDSFDRARAAFASVRTSRYMQDDFRGMEALVGRITTGTGLRR